MKKIIFVFAFMIFAGAAFCQDIADTLAAKQNEIAAAKQNKTPEQKSFFDKLKEAVFHDPAHGTGKAVFDNPWAKECAQSMFFTGPFFFYITTQDKDYLLQDCLFENYKDIFGLKCMKMEILGVVGKGATQILFSIDTCDAYKKWWPEWGDYASEISARKSFEKPWHRP